MKRPSRPAKRKAVKRAPKVTKPKMPKFRLTIGTKEDPLHVDPATIPVGFALQWVNQQGNDNVDTARDRGWLPVKNVAPVSGLVLVWAPKALADTQIDELIAAARKQSDDVNKLFNISKDGREGRPFQIAPPSFMVSSAYEVVPPDVDPVDVEVTVKFRLSRRFQDAAAALKLTVEEYAQRRMSLYVNGSLGGILLPTSGLEALELHETGNFSLHSRI